MFLLLAAYPLQISVRAQAPEPDVLRIDTDLENLNVSVFNRKGAQLPASLQQKDFAVLDNGEPQEISFFASNDAPFDLVLLLDLSATTADKIGLIKKSAKRFVDAARPGDRIAILTSTAHVLPVSKLPSEHAALKNAIDDLKKTVG